MKINSPNIIQENLTQLFELCKKFRVQRLFAFGSVVTERFNIDESDVDFVVELENMAPLDRGENLIALWEELETLFDRKVDLITNQPIKNPYLRESINSTKQLIYDRESEKVFS